MEKEPQFPIKYGNFRSTVGVGKTLRHAEMDVVYQAERHFGNLHRILDTSEGYRIARTLTGAILGIGTVAAITGLVQGNEETLKYGGISAAIGFASFAVTYFLHGRETKKLFAAEQEAVAHCKEQVRAEYHRREQYATEHSRGSLEELLAKP